MIKSLFLLFCLFSCSMLSAAESAVMDIYTGAGTPCNGNSTYVYDFPSLQYACIMDKPGNDGVLILNGKENTLYTGVETVAFGHSGALILNLKKGNLHSILT